MNDVSGDQAKILEGPAPLAGVRVLDLTRVLAGPWATQLLADLGADVVKVERRGRGDDTHGWAPPYAVNERTGARESAFFLSCNRGKRSIEIDFSSAEDCDLVRRLAGVADVVVENFKVGGLVKYGLDALTLRGLHPRLIYCSITGFGQIGPYAKRPGYDFVIQGMGGLMSLTGLPDGVPGGEPVKVGVALTDLMTGLYAANAIQAALIERQRTGVGRAIDLALLDVQVAALANHALSYLVTGDIPERTGNAAPGLVPYDVFQTSDGCITIAVGNDSQFAALCRAIGQPELASDPRFETNAGRVAHRHEIMPVLNDAVMHRTAAEWSDVLIRHGVPTGPVNDISEVFDNEQVRARQMLGRVPHASLGEVPTVACPIRFDGQQTPLRMGPPTIGQHSAEIKGDWLGVS